MFLGEELALETIVKLYNSSHLKIDGWKIAFLFFDGIFSGAKCWFQGGYSSCDIPGDLFFRPKKSLIFHCAWNFCKKTCRGNNRPAMLGFDMAGLFSQLLMFDV